MQNEMSNAVQQIEVGKTYSTRSACDHECVFTVEILSRKGQWVTIRNWDNKVRRCKVRVYGGRESIMPERYSMAPVFGPK